MARLQYGEPSEVGARLRDFLAAEKSKLGRINNLEVAQKGVLMRAIRLHARGGPERLLYEDAPLPDPAAGEALLRVYAAGITPTAGEQYLICAQDALSA